MTPTYFTYDVDKGIRTLTADCDEIDWSLLKLLFWLCECNRLYFLVEKPPVLTLVLDG